VNKKYSRSPNTSEILQFLVILSCVVVAAVLTYYDTDYFFRVISLFACFYFLYYFYKRFVYLFCNVLELRENTVLIPGHKFAKEKKLPDNMYSVSSLTILSSSFLLASPVSSKKKVPFGDMYEYRLTKDNIKSIRHISDKGEIADIVAKRDVDDAQYSMVTNTKQIVEITFVKKVAYFDGEEKSDRRAAISSIFFSVRNHKDLIASLNQGR